MQRHEVVAKRQLRSRMLWLVLAVICGLAFALGVVDLLFLDDGAMWLRLARTGIFTLIGGAFLYWVGIGAWNRAAGSPKRQKPAE